MRVQGQTALEVLLLTGGAVLVVIIVLLMAIGTLDFGNEFEQEKIEEYKKIDLCTAQGAACNLHLDWDAGLQDSPYGYLLENTSDWRTLYIDEITIQLFCGNALCTKSDFTEASGPQFGFVLPIVLNGGTPACSSQSGVISCTYCDPEDPEVGSCVNLPGLPGCQELDGAGMPLPPEEQVCEVTYSLYKPSLGGMAITLLPSDDPTGLAVQKVGVSAGNLNSNALSSVRIVSTVKQLDGGVLKNASKDEKASKVFWFSSTPDHTGTSFACENLDNPTAPSYADFGCSYSPGCQYQNCNDPLVGSALYEYCSDQGWIGTYNAVCQTGSSFYPITCTGLSSTSGDAWFTLNASHGATILVDATPLLNVSTYLPSYTPSLTLDVADFSETSSCDNDVNPDDPIDLDNASAACHAECGGMQSQLAQIKFYDLTGAPETGEALCAALQSSNIPVGGSPSMTGYVDGEGKGHCSALYDVSAYVISQLGTGTQLLLGMKTPGGGVDAKISSPFYNSTYAPSMRAFFTAK